MDAENHPKKDLAVPSETPLDSGRDGWGIASREAVPGVAGIVATGQYVGER